MNKQYITVDGRFPRCVSVPKGLFPKDQELSMERLERKGMRFQYSHFLYLFLRIYVVKSMPLDIKD